ncbi:MAG: 50S ribosomal protein L13 [Bdellovibrionota bacterium]|nr:50S ribosomal protein L13 [Pseudomonadota bacterium]MDY6090200.1 50S ribosomal protein L13 [Bdellovibrionota bacterium]
MKTTEFLSKEEALKNREWYVVDATDVPVGRLASEVATLIRGKHKPTYTPHVDCGDFVIVINAGKVKLTGNKLQDKNYYHYTGYVGGIKSKAANKLIEENPAEIITRAVKGMLTKGTLGHQLMNKLKVYKDANYPQVAQKPKVYQVKSAN